MRRLLLRVVAALALLFIGVVAIAALMLRASLPQLDGELVVSGLGDGATIARDSDGIPDGIEDTNRGQALWFE